MQPPGLKRAQDYILDILFPIECLGCGEEGAWICSQCLPGIKLLPRDACPVCGREAKNNKICFGCRNKNYLSGLAAGASYGDRLVKEAIHLFKYRFLPDLAAPLAEILIEQFREFPELADFVVVPVPLHPRRLAWRGFNQSRLIAGRFSGHYKLALVDGSLLRIRNTIPQAEISDRLRRLNNIKGAFDCADSSVFRGKKIILIDDVATTLATLDECARVLRLAGAREVWGAVVARG